MFVMMDIMKILLVNHVNYNAFIILLYQYVHHVMIRLTNQDHLVNGNKLIL